MDTYITTERQRVERAVGTFSDIEGRLQPLLDNLATLLDAADILDEQTLQAIISVIENIDAILASEEFAEQAKFWAEQAEHAKVAAASYSNYRGLWIEASGGAIRPVSFLHKNLLWGLAVGSVNDVTQTEPDHNNPDWTLLSPTVVGAAGGFEQINPVLFTVGGGQSIYDTGFDADLVLFVNGVQQARTNYTKDGTNLIIHEEIQPNDEIGIFLFVPESELRGPKGDSGTIEIGDVNTVDSDQPATVNNVGTPESAVLDFGIPRGLQGIQGVVGPSLDFDWDGSNLGVKKPEEENYVYTDLKGETGYQAAPDIHIVRDEKYVRYDTLTEAKNDAVAGETIVVTRGTYNEQDLLKDQVNWHFEEGVVLLFDDPFTELEAIPKGFTDENTGPVTSKITGLLDIRTTTEAVVSFPLLLVNGSNIEFSYRHSWGSGLWVVNNGILSIEGKTGIECMVTDGTTQTLPGIPETPAQAWVEAKFENLDDAALMATGGEANFILAGGSGSRSGSVGDVVLHKGTGSVRIEDVNYRDTNIFATIESTEVDFTIVNSTISGAIRSDSNIYVENSILFGVHDPFLDIVNSIKTIDSNVDIDLTIRSSRIECRVDENVNIINEGPETTHTLPLGPEDLFEVYGPNGRKYVSSAVPTIETRSTVLADPNILLEEYNSVMGSLISRKVITINSSTVRYIPTGSGNSYEFDKDGGSGRMTFTTKTGATTSAFRDTPIVSGDRHNFIGFIFTDDLVVTGLDNVFINCTFSGINNIETAEFRDCTIETLSGIPNVDGIKMYNCTLQSGEFPEPINGGALINCIDGNGNLITAFSDD